ncbi:hypothetical protein D3C71_1088990 [compost metagenome]
MALAVPLRPFIARELAVLVLVQRVELRGQARRLGRFGAVDEAIAVGIKLGPGRRIGGGRGVGGDGQAGSAGGQQQGQQQKGFAIAHGSLRFVGIGVRCVAPTPVTTPGRRRR